MYFSALMTIAQRWLLNRCDTGDRKVSFKQPKWKLADNFVLKQERAYGQATYIWCTGTLFRYSTIVATFTWFGVGYEFLCGVSMESIQSRTRQAKRFIHHNPTHWNLFVVSFVQCVLYASVIWILFEMDKRFPFINLEKNDCFCAIFNLRPIGKFRIFDSIGYSIATIELWIQDHVEKL